MLIDLFADKNSARKADPILTDETSRILEQLKQVYTLFNEVTDPYETESLVYRMKELELHYSHLIKEAKLQKIHNTRITGGVIK